MTIARSISLGILLSCLSFIIIELIFVSNYLKNLILTDDFKINTLDILLAFCVLNMIVIPLLIGYFYSLISKEYLDHKSKLIIVLTNITILISVFYISDARQALIGTQFNLKWEYLILQTLIIALSIITALIYMFISIGNKIYMGFFKRD